MIQKVLKNINSTRLEHSEIGADGSKVEKIVKDNFHFVYGNDYKLNFGEYQINIKKDKGELIEGNYYIELKKKLI